MCRDANPGIRTPCRTRPWRTLARPAVRIPLNGSPKNRACPSFSTDARPSPCDSLRICCIERGLCVAGRRHGTCPSSVERGGRRPHETYLRRPRRRRLRRGRFVPSSMFSVKARGRNTPAFRITNLPTSIRPVHQFYRSYPILSYPIRYLTWCPVFKTGCVITQRTTS
jgi:hypothetical protein